MNIDLDPMLIVGILVFVVVTVAMVVISLYIYVFYSHENEETFPGIKYLIISVVFTIYISIFTLVMVPMDYMNGSYNDPNPVIGLDVNSIWKTLAFLGFISYVLNTFWLQYYRYFDIYHENPKDPQIQKRILFSLKYIGKCFIMGAIILFPLTYIYGGQLEYNFEVIDVHLNDMAFSANGMEKPAPINFIKWSFRMIPGMSNMVRPPLVLLGSFLLYVIGAFGMASVPISLFTMWFKRPKIPNADDIVMTEIILREDSVDAINKLKDLIELGDEIAEQRLEPNHDRESLKRKIETINIEVIIIQKKLMDHENMRATKKREQNIIEENPLKYLLCLVAGIIFSLMSICIMVHTFFSMFDNDIVIETILFELDNLNVVYSMLGYLVFAFYMFFCTIKGFEKLSYMFPNYLGYNQMSPNRTWIDTWIIIANLLIPVSWAIVGYFIKTCPNFFYTTYGSFFLTNLVFKMQYLRLFMEYDLFCIISLFSFMIGLVMAISNSMANEELTKKVKETRNEMQANQLKYQKNMNGFAP